MGWIQPFSLIWLLNSVGLQGFAGYSKDLSGRVKACDIGGALGKVVEVQNFDQLEAACTSTDPCIIVITKNISKTGTNTAYFLVILLMTKSLTRPTIIIRLLHLLITIIKIPLQEHLLLCDTDISIHSTTMSVTRRASGGQANYKRHTPYQQAMITLGKQNNVAVIDMTDLTTQLYNNLYNAGASKITQMIVEQARKQGLIL